MESNNHSRILQTARDLFNIRGYRSVTIQDLADKLGMSKKTIYQYFSSKEVIAAAVVEETMKMNDDVVTTSLQAQSNPVEVIKAILIHAREDTMRFGPLFMMDIEKYLPDLSSRYREFRNSKRQSIEQLLKTAQENGLIRDIPIHLTTEILSVTLKAVVQTETLPQQRFSVPDALDLFIDIFCHGIKTPEK